jgi:DNA-binding winged helix-turn-helix (wHTH) protein
MDVLMLLVSRQGSLVLRQDFMEQIWPDGNVSDEVLTRAISVLRKLFRVLDPETTYIETIPRRGYSLPKNVLSTALSLGPKFQMFRCV